jgi:GR25 family glycosyltransferase involved in LPS biosynthesis
MQAYFESLPHDDSCPYCTGRSAATPLPGPLDAIYCISLQDQPHRTHQAAAHLHRLGLCRLVSLYRPVRGKNGTRAIWESHRAVACHAVANGCRSALILEDDVYFHRPWAKLAPRIAGAIAALPSDWRALYLGHIPLQAYFVTPTILRVRTGGAHAYVASRRLLTWLAATEPLSAEVPTWPINGGIDGAMAELPDMYALFPMAAQQRFLGDHRIATHVDDAGRTRLWRDPNRWRYYALFRGARTLEAFAVALSPLHWLTLERNRKRSSETWIEAVHLIRQAALFDESFYVTWRSDVGAQELNPLRHYLEYGAGEWAWPCALFDPLYYAAQCPDLGRQNPLVHFIRVGTALGRKPHPLFETEFYLSRYGAKIPQGMHPLDHFLTLGGQAGFDPHPLFDSAWYLARHPELRQHGQNPLVHYLTEGWRQGAAPHPQFDGELYLHCHPDVKAAGVNPLEHFVRHGQAEGRAQPLPQATMALQP